MVRQLDLKKPPSIAESIDWARTLLLVGADDIDRETFEQSMSIIVKHRSDIDLVAERVAVKLGDAPPAERPHREPLRAERGQSGRVWRRRQPARLLRGAALGGGRVGTSEILDAFAALEQVPWTDQRGLPRGARRDDRQVPGGPARLRAPLRPLLLPRRRGRGARARDRGGALRGLRPLDLDELREAIRQAITDGNDGEMRDLARLAIAAFGRRGERSGVIGVDVQRIRRSAGPPGARRAAARARAPAAARPRGRAPSSSSTCAASWSGRRSSAPASCLPLAPAGRARPRASDQPRPGPRVGAPRRRAAEAPDRHPRPRAARPPQGRAWSTCAAPCAPRWRRAACRCGCATGRSAPAGPRSTCSATSRPRSAAPASSSSRAARAPRLVPQAAQLRLHRADHRGHRHLRARARLPGDLRARSRPRAASPMSPATPTTDGSGSSSGEEIAEELGPRRR